MAHGAPGGVKLPSRTSIHEKKKQHRRIDGVNRNDWIATIRLVQHG